MLSIFKTALRATVIVGVIGGILAGGTMLIAGTERTKAIVHKVHDEVMTRIDNNIDDPVALRTQLKDLEKEYPSRIAQVRGDLAELYQQIRQLEREKAISERVVAMTEQDLDVLEEKLSSAAQEFEGDSGSNLRLASIAFNNRVYNYDRAAARANQIRATRSAHANRAADAQHDLGYLHQQAERLDELLLQLEAEHNQFQAQVWQLSRQVDAIARNERLIELLDKRNRTIEECSRYHVESLDQLTGRLAEYRARQEAELDLLSNAQRRVDYEDTARIQLESDAAEGLPLEGPVLRRISDSSPSLETEIR